MTSSEQHLSAGRRELLRRIATLPLLAVLPTCAAASRTDRVATLHGDGIHDDSPALTEIFAGRAVLHRGRLQQFDRRPPKATYFIGKAIEVPDGITLQDIIFYAWVRPAIMLAPGAKLQGCWTCVAPVDPTDHGLGTGPVVVRR